MSIIGTGGNFRRILKIRNLYSIEKKRHIKPFEFENIKKEIKSLSYEERIQELNLRPDRADVILPAVEIIDFVLQDLEISKIFAPNTGLVDGILENLSNQFCA